MFLFFVLVFFGFFEFTIGQNCSDYQQSVTRTCFAPHFLFNRSSDDINFDNRFANVGLTGLSDSEILSQCRVLSDLTSCIKSYNVTSCVTGSTFISILSTDYSQAIYNVSLAKNLNCVNNTRAILTSVKCPSTSQNDANCAYNSTTVNDCSIVQKVVNCQLPKAKQFCGLLAAEYVCSYHASLYPQCSNSICYNVNLTGISGDKQMLYSAADRGTLSIIFSFLFICFSLFLNFTRDEVWGLRPWLISKLSKPL